jgi:hypothetical protein
LSNSQEDDVYGAAAMIMDKYPDELLATCEHMSGCKNKAIEFKKMAFVFQLHLGINHSPIIGKTVEEIEKDSYRWRAISDIAKEKKHRRPLLSWLKY